METYEVQKSYAQWLGKTDADLKNKCNVGAYRLIKKAEANIEALQKGMFGGGALGVKIFTTVEALNLFYNMNIKIRQW